MACRGTSLALSKDGQLLLNRTFGWATPERKKPLPVVSKFRIASVDKMLTKTGAGVFFQGGWRIKGMSAPFDEGTRPFKVSWTLVSNRFPGRPPTKGSLTRP